LVAGYDDGTEGSIYTREEGTTGAEGCEEKRATL